MVSGLQRNTPNSQLWQTDFKGIVQHVIVSGFYRNSPASLYGKQTTKEQSSYPVMVTPLQRNSPASPRTSKEQSSQPVMVSELQMNR
jgi:isocitrate dehydrogenase kinase/phosphatase